MNIQKPEQKQPQNQITMMKTMGFAAEFGFIIALPLIALVYVGKYLDGRHHTKYFTVSAIFLALIISTTILYRRIKSILDDLKKK